MILGLWVLLMSLLCWWLMVLWVLLVVGGHRVYGFYWSLAVGGWWSLAFVGFAGSMVNCWWSLALWVLFFNFFFFLKSEKGKREDSGEG